MRKAKQAMALAMTAALAAGLMSGCSTKKAAVELSLIHISEPTRRS